MHRNKRKHSPSRTSVEGEPIQAKLHSCCLGLFEPLENNPAPPVLRRGAQVSSCSHIESAFDRAISPSHATTPVVGSPELSVDLDVNLGSLLSL